MSVKQEGADSMFPLPPPLVQHGMRPQYNLLPTPSAVNMAMTRPPALQPSPSTTTPAQQQEGPSTSSNPQSSFTDEELNKRIDKASIKGTFGWETLDNANIPCIFRGGDKFVSVRMVEQKLLSKYPSTYPDELRNRPPLMSQFITKPEARLLNEINIEHCACEYGQRSFTEKDLVVRLKDFVEFYQIVKKHFPNEQRPKDKPSQNRCPESSGGGWVQVNNTVVPYIRRHTPTTKEVLNLAPLPVLRYAAGLLKDNNVPSLEPTDDECKLLSDMCKSAGLEFNFSHNTPLILLQQLPVYCSTKVIIKRLPDDDPFGNAEYCPEFDDEETKVTPVPINGVLLPTMQDLSGQSRPPPPAHIYSSGPPNVTVQPGVAPFPAAAIRLAQNGPRPDSGSQPLQALEQIAGPPRKKSRSSNSPGDHDARRTPNDVRQASPNQPVQSGGTHTMYPTGMGPLLMPVPQGMPHFRPGQLPFPPRPGMMPPPGILQGPSNMWPAAPTNPADMQKLAQMMNMQAAILSGPLGGQPPQQAVSQINGQPGANSPNTQTSQTPPTTNETAKSFSRATTQNAIKEKLAKNKRDSNMDKIQPVDFHGKKISCLVKGTQNEKYALIEAISRVYYPNCSLEEFIKAMTNVLQIPIYQLDREEEKAFISFYGLPTSSLKCNKVLKLSDLDKLMPQLKYMFKGSDIVSTTLSSKPSVSDSKQAQSSNGQPAAQAQDSNNNGGPMLNSSENAMLPTNPFVSGAKKSSSGLGKLSKLEDAVNRLRQKNKLIEQEGPSPSPGASTPGTNQLGQGAIPKNPFLSPK